MFQALRRHGTSVGCITKRLKGLRSPTQVLLKLRSMKKWPGVYPRDIIEIINNGRLLKNT